MVCDRCGVEVTLASVRRQRMGHIELAVPVSHIWFFKCSPSRMGLLLDKTTAELDRVLYYQDWMVTEPGDTPLAKGQILTEQEYLDAQEKYQDMFKADMGAEAVKELIICSMVMSSRDVLGSIDWVKSLKDKGDEIPLLVEKGKAAFSGPELTGKTPHEIIRNIRLKQAANLLSHGDMNVTEVMYAVGMQNAASFSTMFKNFYGVSPKEYTREHSKKEEE